MHGSSYDDFIIIRKINNVINIIHVTFHDILKNDAFG